MEDTVSFSLIMTRVPPHYSFQEFFCLNALDFFVSLDPVFGPFFKITHNDVLASLF
jgi:hypothetical protein